MTIADDDTNPKPSKKRLKSLDAITALRQAMEQRLAEATAQEQPPVEGPQEKELPPPEEKPQLAPPAAAPSSAPEKARKTKGNKPAKPAPTAPDPAEWSRMMLRIAGQSQKLIQDYLERHKDRALPIEAPAPDSAHLTEAFTDLTNRILSDPERFAEAQIALWQGYIKIWKSTMKRMGGQPVEPVITPSPADKRFQDEEWRSNWLFDYIKQSYLLTAQSVYNMVRTETEKIDPKQARKLDFYTRQIVDAASPSNFWLTNPEVLRATMESNGENLVKGLGNLLGDLERGHGQLRISMADTQAFKVGENIAVTPGQVIYQNDLMQLIQYAPQTEMVARTPLLIIPPWINKFYILDLREKNSFIRHLVSQGHKVFCISWVNPDARHATINFDDYMTDGALAALREIRRVTGEDNVNVLGYCIGGTLLACTLAYLKAAPTPLSDLPNISSATYLVAMVDFAEPGDLGVFIDEDQITALEARMAAKGYLEAAALATTFNMLRANDLIWSFVVNNYLLGKEPFPFDILYWNSDSTNLPAAMHSYYLRGMYLKNKLIEPNALQMKGVPIDVSTITTPSFLLSTRDDHIAPWKTTYTATQLYKGPVRFVLSGSGHIAGVVNPPAANKYCYWTNENCPHNPDEWLEAAQYHDGSWWPEWLAWLKTYSGEQTPAREVRNGIEPAPGSYVKVRAE